MKLTMLGTGHALVTECYNTCFVIEDDGKYFMVDGGGGNSILCQLSRVGLDWTRIKEIFVPHKHIDHLTGIVWMMRMICQAMNRGTYTGEVNVYSHKEVVDILLDLADKLLLQKETRFIGKRLHFIVITDGEERIINDRKVSFFDIHSTKTTQFGFSMELDNGERLTCCGDEPYNPCEERYVRGCKWLLHEAFCLFSEADIHAPYEKHHSTVKEACELAEKLNVQNLLLYHTEDNNIRNRKKLYMTEGKKYYSGNLWIPDDLETINI